MILRGEEAVDSEGAETNLAVLVVIGMPEYGDVP